MDPTWFMVIGAVVGVFGGLASFKYMIDKIHLNKKEEAINLTVVPKWQARFIIHILLVDLVASAIILYGSFQADGLYTFSYILLPLIVVAALIFYGAFELFKVRKFLLIGENTRDTIDKIKKLTTISMAFIAAVPILSAVELLSLIGVEVWLR